MCLFKYREKRYGKLTFILFSLLVIALSAGAVFGGYYAYININHWAKYVVASVAGIVALCLAFWGLTMFIMAFSMVGGKKSARDVNKTKGVRDVRLCEKCGRKISKHAVVCEHCGAKLHEGLGCKKCPECKTKNSAKAKFCEHCGYEFKD